MRLVVARCEVAYTGRLSTVLPEAIRLLMFKDDGSFLVHDDAGGYKPLNWMTPPTVVEEERDAIVVRKRAGKTEDRLEVRLGSERRTLGVTGLAERRGPAAVASTLYEEDPESVAERERQRAERRLARPLGADLGARPTKRDRRRLDSLRAGQRRRAG